MVLRTGCHEGRAGAELMAGRTAGRLWNPIRLIALAVLAALMLSLALLFVVYLLAEGVFTIVAATRAAQSHE
jgi:hypothetical protein